MTNQQLIEKFENLEAESKFITSNIKELIKKYSGQFVAIYNNKIFANNKMFGEVIDKIKKNNIDLSFVLIKYIPSEEEIILY